MRNRKWGLAAAAAALAVVIGAGVVMAQSEDDGTGIAFLDRVAEKLGVDRQTLDTAIQDARSDEIDEAVANGDLTQEQADRLKERVDNLPADAPFIGPGLGRGFGHEFRGGEGLGFAFKLGFNGHGGGFDNEALATFLGIDETQLGEEQRADGATMATVAEAHGKSRDELKAFITGELQTKLDEAVAAGDLTRERADEIIAEFNERLDDIIDNEFAARPFGGRAFKDELLFGVALPRPLHVWFISEGVAAFLGLDQAQLRAELAADGATLASVAEAHGKSRDDLKGFLTSDTDARLDEAVASGAIDQAQADEFLANFNERLDALIDGQFRGFGPVYRGGPAMPFGDEMFDEQMEIEPDAGAEESELTPASRS